MSHAVLFLGGPLDGTRAEVDELREYHVAIDWGAVQRVSFGDWKSPARNDRVGVRVVYTLEELRDGQNNITHYLYVRKGLNTLAQLLHGYREARS